MIHDDGIIMGGKGGTELQLAELIKRLGRSAFDGVELLTNPMQEPKTSLPRILWIHEDALEESSTLLSDRELRRRYNLFVFVSHFQRERFHNLLNFPRDAPSTVLPNSVSSRPTNMSKWSKKPDVLKLAYVSTPQRGLDVLYDAFSVLAASAEYDVELNVYSGFDHYGPAHMHRNEPFEELFEKVSAHPNINYHRPVSHDEILKVLDDTHILAYPSTYVETFCVSAVEAMVAGCIPVVPAYGALIETVGPHHPVLDWPDDRDGRVITYTIALQGRCDQVMTTKVPPGYIESARHGALMRFDWNKTAKVWKALLNGLSE